MARVNDTAPGLPKLTRPATLDHLRKKPRAERVVLICMEPELARAREEADRKLQTADFSLSRNGKTTHEERERVMEPLRAALKEAEAAAEEASVEVLVRSIGRVAFERLTQEHPPTEEDHAELKKVLGESAQAGFNFETFAPVLIAASTVVPEITAEEVAEITGDWTKAEFDRWWQAALEVNQNASTVSLGKSRTASNGTGGSKKN